MEKFRWADILLTQSNCPAALDPVQRSAWSLNNWELGGIASENLRILVIFSHLDHPHYQ